MSSLFQKFRRCIFSTPQNCIEGGIEIVYVVCTETLKALQHNGFKDFAFL